MATLTFLGARPVCGEFFSIKGVGGTWTFEGFVFTILDLNGGFGIFRLFFESFLRKI